MTTIIVGGGWSGLAAAVRLTQMGETVHLFEAAKQLGGRARNISWQGLDVDNGQHLLIGAYSRTLDLLKTVGASESVLFQRKSLDLTIHHPNYAPLLINAGKTLPWPLSVAWQLWRDNGFTVFKQVSQLLVACQGLSKKHDLSVKSWLSQHKQSARLVEQLWEPLCLAMLNTPIEHASAKVFSHVLTETFRKRRNTDLLLTTHPLGDSVPHHAAAFIEHHGGKISRQSRVKQLNIHNKAITGITLENEVFIPADHVIVATNPKASQSLLTPHISFTDPGSYPITTVYLQYSSDIRLSQPIVGLSGTISQWLFERHDIKPGLVTVVISGPGEHERLDKAALVEKVAKEIKWLMPKLPAAPYEAYVIREKRATFACNVDIEQQRPNNRTEIMGLWLAGDYIKNGYPATLEGAIINGEQTATQLMEHQHASR
ncbi:hydroxysqualene dehydroxylase HpnE [Methylophaga sp.]|uniref:hydroxysqualene dehydroxylase HpnE n=1 Tax=Methylophaga sp. TaxID=2024840 RepID=UPI003F69AFA9